jgi:F-type H+-transporting ATPase subunit gamma
MANLKEIRGRITSVNSTRQITSAMKMVSAAKLRRAQDAITKMRPYAQKLQEILSNLSASLDTSEGVYSEDRELKNVVVVAITSNRGLCGGFNNNVIKRAKSLASEYSSSCNVTVLSIGKKADDVFRKTEWNIKGIGFPKHMNSIFDDLTFSRSVEISQILMNQFVDKNIDRVILVYNQFKNAASQEVMAEQFLPVLPPETSQQELSVGVDYIFEPDKKGIVEELIPKSLKLQFFKALLDSHAAEHGARMTAMHQATDNATSLLHELKLTYNKARQAAITNEILEIVSGAQALEN